VGWCLRHRRVWIRAICGHDGTWSSANTYKTTLTARHRPVGTGCYDSNPISRQLRAVGRCSPIMMNCGGGCDIPAHRTFRGYSEHWIYSGCCAPRSVFSYSDRLGLGTILLSCHHIPWEDRYNGIRPSAGLGYD